MNYILFDPSDIEKFYPFTLTRPLGEMRLFGGTIKEIWERRLGQRISYLTYPHLESLYSLYDDNPTTHGSDDMNELVFIPSNWVPKPDSKFDVKMFQSEEGFRNLFSLKWSDFRNDSQRKLILRKLEESLDISYLEKHLFKISNNMDFILGSSTCGLNSNVNFSTQEKSNIDCANPFFDDDDGPIIIEDGVNIMSGTMIKGPVYICKGSVIKMGTRIYGPTIIGPYCKIGGEVSNCIFLGYSNKAHEGFLGHSIIGEWCNIGAGTSNSNLKNDYGKVKMWDYTEKKFIDSGEQFLGLYMGDHSKVAINTSFNTGTTIGVNCNIFGPGFPRNFIPSFSWGGAQGFKEYDFDKALVVLKNVLSRRDVKLTKEYVKMFHNVHVITTKMK